MGFIFFNHYVVYVPHKFVFSIKSVNICFKNCFGRTAKNAVVAISRMSLIKGKM